MAIGHEPSSFNFEEHDGLRELLGYSFIDYYAKDYSSHERLKAMLQAERSEMRPVNKQEHVTDAERSAANQTGGK